MFFELYTSFYSLNNPYITNNEILTFIRKKKQIFLIILFYYQEIIVPQQ